MTSAQSYKHQWQYLLQQIAPRKKSGQSNALQAAANDDQKDLLFSAMLEQQRAAVAPTA